MCVNYGASGDSLAMWFARGRYRFRKYSVVEPALRLHDQTSRFRRRIFSVLFGVGQGKVEFFAGPVSGQPKPVFWRAAAGTSRTGGKWASAECRRKWSMCCATWRCRFAASSPERRFRPMASVPFQRSSIKQDLKSCQCICRHSSRAIFHPWSPFFVSPPRFTESDRGTEFSSKTSGFSFPESPFANTTYKTGICRVVNCIRHNKESAPACQPRVFKRNGHFWGCVLSLPLHAHGRRDGGE